MQRFLNEPTAAQSLPKLDDDAFVAVDKNFLRISMLGFAVVAAVVAIGCALLLWLSSIDRWIPLVIGAVLLGLVGARAGLRVLEVRNIAYQVRTHDLSIRRGVLVKTVSTVPFVRVQHARIRQGPIQRRFGLASLEVSSAGPDIEVRGLTSDTAERLKVLVVQRAGDLTES